MYGRAWYVVGPTDVTLDTIFSILWKGMNAAVLGRGEVDGRHARGKGKIQALGGSIPCLLNSEGLDVWTWSLG